MWAGQPFLVGLIYSTLLDSTLLDSTLTAMPFCPPSHRHGMQAIPCFRDLATHYPDRLNAIRVINAPSAASFVYMAFLKPVMSENTRQKVCIVGDRESQAMIAKELGGAVAADLKRCQDEFDAAKYLAHDC